MHFIVCICDFLCAVSEPSAFERKGIEIDNHTLFV